MGKLFFLAALFLFQAFAGAQDLSSNIPNSEIIALIEFGQQLRSPVVTWNTNQGFCSQQGVICSADANGQLTVSGIDLRGTQLSGLLPTSLAALPNLRLLNLSNNSLSGTIPAAYGELHNLTTLDLSHNRFFGTIPRTLVGLTQLRSLNLANNFFSGSFPPGFNFGQLNTLLLGGNEFCPLGDYSLVSVNDYGYYSSSNSGCQICGQYSCLNDAQCIVNSDQTFRCVCPEDFVGQYCELNLAAYGPQQSNEPSEEPSQQPTSGGPSWGQGNPGVQPGDSSTASPALKGSFFHLALIALVSLLYFFS